MSEKNGIIFLVKLVDPLQKLIIIMISKKFLVHKNKIKVIIHDEFSLRFNLSKALCLWLKCIVKNSPSNVLGEIHS